MRSAYGRSTREPSPDMSSASKKNAESGSSRRACSTPFDRPNRRIVTWKGWGLPSGRKAMASPSSTSSRGSRPRAHSVTSGTRAVTSWSCRVNTRTSSPALCTWMRAPSSLYSKAASPSRSRASSTSCAGFASMGATGWSTRSEKRPRPAAPSSRAARATSPRWPENIAAWRTVAAGRRAARAMASSTRPSRAPCRTSPMSSSTRSRRSGSSARSNRPRRTLVRRSPDPAPFSAARASNVWSSSARVKGAP